MSTAEILSLISKISFAGAVVSFVVAVFFWFKFKILSVIGDLSGRTAKKSIAKMRANNEKAGGKGYKPSATNVSRGKLTDTMQHSKKLAEDSPKKNNKKAKMPSTADAPMPETGLLETNKAKVTKGEETALLDDSEATGLLTDEDATALLDETLITSVKRSGGVKLSMIEEVMLIHTEEVIQ